MQQKIALVITSISKPNNILRLYADECKARNIDFIVIGDVSSPKDFQIDGCDFWSIERQRTLDFKLARLLPERHYARKNLGYLIAMQRGADIIIETDDDNIPMKGFWAEKNAFRTAHHIEGAGWTNVYRYFSDSLIWPRGFPLDRVKDLVKPLSSFPIKEVFCPIQQGLADDNPDVDAIYRLLFALPIKFKTEAPLALGLSTYCPFNSQNTVWFKEAFPLLYLPSFCSFRMTDIWRSFAAQMISTSFGWTVLYHNATVLQERNEHDLIKDFSDEVVGYTNNGPLIDSLAKLKLSAEISDAYINTIKCYETMISSGLVDKKELGLIECWFDYWR